MQQRTPIESAVATYCADWRIVQAHQSGFSVVNPETLENGTPPDYRFRYIDIGSVTKGRIDWETVQTIRFADSPSRARRVLRPGDVMVCTVRPLLGSHASADWTEQNGHVCSTGFAVLRADGGLNPRFLRHVPFCEQVTRQLVAWQCGTNYPAVNERDVRILRLPVPPVDEQAAIARILDAVDTAIERTREAVERARDLRKSLLADLLSRGIGENGYVRDLKRSPKQFRKTPYGTLPTSWRLSTIGKEFVLQNGFTLNEDRRPRYRKRGYLRVANVQRDELLLDDVQELEASDAEFVPRVLEVNDLLVVEGHAERMQIGRCARISEDARGLTFQNHLFRLRACGEVVPCFGCLWLNSAFAQRYWNARCATSSGLNTINQRMLKRLTVPVPPEPEQRNIATLVAKQREHLEALTEKLARLRCLKASLMHDLLTGRVRVNHLNLEPVLRR